MKKIFCILLCIITVLSSSGCFLFNNNADDTLALGMDTERGLKILHFADIHFGTEGTMYHNQDVARTIEFMDYAVELTKPDFIVLLGDNMFSTGIEGAKNIVNLMDKYKTPYTFVFGNHDAEIHVPLLQKSDVSDYLSNCDSPYLLYKSGYVESGYENRFGNFSINVQDNKNGKLLGAITVIDTGVYDYQKAEYQAITEGQISWYKDEITRLNEIYKSENDTEKTIPGIVYGHIQLPEHSSALKYAIENDPSLIVYGEKLPSWAIQSVRDDAGKRETGFFDALVEMESAKVYLAGHMHGLNYHVMSDGVMLGFCPQTAVQEKGKGQMSTFLYTVNADFDISLELIKEVID